MRAAMAEASRIVLSGFELRTDVMRVDYPERFRDPRGDVMWTKVTELISQTYQHAGPNGRRGGGMNRSGFEIDVLQIDLDRSHPNAGSRPRPRR